MNFRQLSYFMSVAKHLNFTKAAEENNIIQTAMSQQISALEKALGFKLFCRNSRSVQLTPAGKVFLEEIKDVLGRYENAVEKAKQAESGIEGKLSISYWGTNPTVLVPELLEKFHQAHPKIKVSLIQKPYIEALDSIINGLLDVAFVSPYVVKDYKDIQYTKLKTSSLCVVMNKNHPLANEPVIPPEALAKENFIIVDIPGPQKLNEQFIKHCRSAGFEPNIIMRPTQFTEVLLLVEAGIGITILPDSGNKHTFANLVIVNIDGCQECHEVGIAWSQGNRNPSVPIFLEIINNTRNAQQFQKL